jgi:hypothetical protein
MLKYTKTVLVMLALLLAVLGPLLVAAQEDGDDDPIPPPTGPYQVGQTYRHWVDESRDEPYHCLAWAKIRGRPTLNQVNWPH